MARSKEELHAIEEIKRLMRSKNIYDCTGEVVKITGRNRDEVRKILDDPGKSNSKLQIQDYIAIADYFNISLDELFGRSSPGGLSACVTIKDICKSLLAIYQSPLRFSIDASNCKEDGCVRFYFPYSVSSDSDKSEPGKWDNRYEAAITINDFLEKIYEYGSRSRNGRLDEEKCNKYIQDALDDVSDSILEYPETLWDLKVMVHTDKVLKNEKRRLKKEND